MVRDSFQPAVWDWSLIRSTSFKVHRRTDRTQPRHQPSAVFVFPLPPDLSVALGPNGDANAVIKGKFGWDPVIGACWLTDDNAHNRLVWQVATQLLWIVLAEVITMSCAGITIAHLYKHKVFSNSCSESNITHRYQWQFTSLKATKRGSSHQSYHVSTGSNGKDGDFRADLARKTANNLTTQRGFRNVIVRICSSPPNSSRTVPPANPDKHCTRS